MCLVERVNLLRACEKWNRQMTNLLFDKWVDRYMTD